MRLLRPCFVCAAIVRALPSGVRGPMLLPPCNLQRFRPPMAGFWQSVPRRVLAKHLVPGQPGPKRVALPAWISSAWLTLFTIYFRRSRGWAFNHRSWSPFDWGLPCPVDRAPRPMDHCSSAARHASPTAFLSRVWCSLGKPLRTRKSMPPAPTSTGATLATSRDWRSRSFLARTVDGALMAV